MLKNRTGKVNVASGNSFTIQPFAGSAGLNDIARNDDRSDLQIPPIGGQKAALPAMPGITEGSSNLVSVELAWAAGCHCEE